LKQHLEDEIAWHEQKADEIERAFETAGEAEYRRPEIAAWSDTPGG